MLIRLITWSLYHRFFVLTGAMVIVAIGIVSGYALNFDAFPDTTPVQVQVNTTVTGLVPEEVERLVTFPVELSLSGLSGLEQVRSISQFGLSQVTVTFRDGTNIYFARQLINERLSQVQMPDGIDRPQMGPVSTGLGEVFHYLLRPKSGDLTEARTIHDWEVKPSLRQTSGTAEINSWGGYEKQYQVRIDPKRLLHYDLSFQQVVDAVMTNNLNVGGGNINRNLTGQMLLVHGIGRTTNVSQIEEIVIASKNGVPVYVKDIADVGIGHEIRRGMVTTSGQGEAVLGLGFMLMGENSYDVTHRLKEKMKDVQKQQEGRLTIDVVYDRTQLVDKVIETVKNNLIDAALLVIVVLYIVMGNLRAGLIVATAIPLSMLFAFNGMLHAGIAGTLLSLGAIDFGVVVESNVVVIENVVRRIAHGADPSLTRLEIVRRAAIEVRQPAVFGQLIIMIVYIPLLTLEGVEGKMFRPMAWTLIFLLSGSLLCSLTVIPVLASLLFPKHLTEDEPFIVWVAKWMYQPVLRLSISHPLVAISSGAAALFLTGLLAMRMGTEFVPRLSEGAIVIGSNRAPGTDIDASVNLNLIVEKTLLKEFPNEIDRIWTRTGGPEVATDPGGVETGDTFVSLKPRDMWTHKKTVPCSPWWTWITGQTVSEVSLAQSDLADLMNQEVKEIPGQEIWFTQPIEQRINEMVSGVRSDIALKLFGPDIEKLLTTSADLAAILNEIPGSADLLVEQISGQPVLQIKIDQDQIARYGIPARDVLDLVESIGSKPLGTIYEGDLRFPIAVRLPDSYRQNPDSIAQIMLTTPKGIRIPLSRVADVSVRVGPRMIPREWSQRRITVMCNVRGRDIGSFVAEAQKRIAEKIQLPHGYRISWGGQFENMQRAQRRLAIVVPLALGLILVLLYMTYGNIVDTAFVFTSVPFACVGGIIALWYREMPISISASVGFITLAGVSVLNNMVVVSAIRDLQAQGLPNRVAITEAALERLRTRLMTAMVAIFGFLPMATSVGVGAEVQRPLATVVIGGVISSTIMTLFVIPALYLFVKPLPRHATPAVAVPPRNADGVGAAPVLTASV